MKSAIVLLAVLSLAGCAPAPVITAATPIPVPCPPPPPVERPALPLENVTPASPPDDIARAFAASLELLGGYAERLEQVLDGYRNPKETQ
ncbi:MAG: hypothetical protein AB1450_13290 [Pseudomonadota bacterium]